MLKIIKDFVLSSTGEGLSARLKSGLAMVASVAVLAGPLIGLHITPESWGEVSDLAVNLVASLSTGVSLVIHIFAWVRRNQLKQAGLGRYAR